MIALQFTNIYFLISRINSFLIYYCSKCHPRVSHHTNQGLVDLDYKPSTILYRAKEFDNDQCSDDHITVNYHLNYHHLITYLSNAHLSIDYILDDYGSGDLTLIDYPQDACSPTDYDHILTNYSFFIFNFIKL